MRVRTKHAITAGDSPLDPIARLATEMMDRVMRNELRIMIKQELMTSGVTIRNYRLEA